MESQVIDIGKLDVIQLLGGITHEINTPLTYVKASCEILTSDIEYIKDVEVKNNMTQCLNQINNGLQRIENVINSINELSKISYEEKIDLNIYSTIITSAILSYDKIKHISNIYINGEQFSLTMAKDKEKYFVKCQAKRVEQVWIIIINNAMDELIKIDGFENRRLDINIINDENCISVQFKDNAGGINNNVMESIFEPSKGSKVSSGIGVGLSIAKKILDDQDAKIEAYNEDDGAVFKIIFNKNIFML
jgi:C4-dicarboxylate-specific signal transduction histidine kinase